MSEQSLLHDMREALRGDFERARQRRESGPPPEAEPVIREIRDPLPRPEPLPDLEPELAPAAEVAEPAAAEAGFLSRLFRR